MNDLAVFLAAEARRLGLDLHGLDDTHPETVQDFARRVLEELAALGLLPGEDELGCWAAGLPRVQEGIDSKKKPPTGRRLKVEEKRTV